jgi:hypothetical protein
MGRTIAQGAKSGLINQKRRLLLLFDCNINYYSGTKLSACGIFHLPETLVMAGAVRRLKINNEGVV